MGWPRRHWKALLLGLAGFLLGIGLGASAGATTTTLTESTTLTTTTTTESTVTETETRTVLRSPPNSGVTVSYGEWEGQGLFRISGAHVVNDFEEHALVLGQFRYLGGANCELGYVAVQGTFFDDAGRVIGSGLWNADSMPRGVGLPMEVSGSVERRAARAEIVLTSADCEN